MTSALGIDGSRSTAAALQRSAASVSSARSSASARSRGESVVWAPGRSGGAARMTGRQPITRSLGFSLPAACSARSMNSLMAFAVAATSGRTRG